MDVNLNVEITHLLDLHIGAETSLTNRHIFALEELDEDNIEEEAKESNNDTHAIFIPFRVFALSFLS